MTSRTRKRKKRQRRSGTPTAPNRATYWWSHLRVGLHMVETVAVLTQHEAPAIAARAVVIAGDAIFSWRSGRVI